MTAPGFRYIYGPVPARRLGLSLGVDLIPFKTCTYDCIYCQLGRTTHKTTERHEYAPMADVLAELEQKLADGPVPDYVTISGLGEPTLHERLGQLIGEIKKLTYIPIAVLTNGSLLWQREVQDALMEADLVLPSLDAGDDFLFRYVNRPHQDITFDQMVQGIAEFTRRFPKPVWLEVFLLAGVTGILPEVEKIAGLARQIQPQRVQLNTVSRPPCEEFACPVSWNQMKEFATLFDGKVEVISEGDKSRSPLLHLVTDADILALLSRRPCTIKGVSAGLGLQVGEAAKRLQALADQRAVIPARENGAIFYQAVRPKEGKNLLPITGTP
ncbi:MAG: radical SAM protein [Syntrophobacterales bacterium]|nr:radical SAM protein [Syntrophobacterales bacterium]